MKYRIYFVLFSCVAIASCSIRHSGSFHTLDETLARRDYYDAAFDSVQDSLKTCYIQAISDSSRWAAAYKIQARYYYHDMDSCHRYVQLMRSAAKGDPGRQIIADSHYASCLFRMDSLSSALRIFEAIPREQLPPEARKAYYSAGYHIYHSIEAFRQQCGELVDDWWETDSTTVEPVFYRSLFLREEGWRVDNTIERLKSCPLVSPNDSAKLNFYLAREYRRAGDVPNAIKYYAASACYDAQISVKVYSALYELSQVLFQAGYVERANRYMRITLEDTRASHYRIHYDDISLASLRIMDALSRQREQKRTAILISLIIVSTLLFIAFFLLLLLRRSSNRLMESHVQVLELSKIKDAFLANYMERCVDYLNKVDDYRSTLRHIVKSEGLDAVLAMLRKPSYSSAEFNGLLDMFDKSFLGIFPDFVQKVNRVMKPQWQLEQPAPGKLSMELRILALIRMGITKRQRIARALNLSVTTVYSYHYNMHRHSLYPDEDFDQIIGSL